MKYSSRIMDAAENTSSSRLLGGPRNNACILPEAIPLHGWDNALFQPAFSTIVTVHTGNIS